MNLNKVILILILFFVFIAPSKVDFLTVMLRNELTPLGGPHTNLCSLSHCDFRSTSDCLNFIFGFRFKDGLSAD